MDGDQCMRNSSLSIYACRAEKLNETTTQLLIKLNTWSCPKQVELCYHHHLFYFCLHKMYLYLSTTLNNIDYSDSINIYTLPFVINLCGDS